ncbi:4781_t:CDS:2, partial [Ambispora leptoticha]
NCEDFQSRRAQIRVKNQAGKKYYPHTLNGSALAVDRLITTLCEYYYQEKENKLNIPEVLQKAINTKRTRTIGITTLHGNLLGEL